MVLFSNVYYSSALSNVKGQEIIQIFKSSANKIDHTITLMEQSAYNLAQHGLSLYLEHNKSNFEKSELKQKFSAILEQHFSLPMYVELKDEDVKDICDIVRNCV